MWILEFEAAFCTFTIAVIPVILIMCGIVYYLKRWNDSIPDPKDDPDEGHLRVYWSVGNKKASRN